MIKGIGIGTGILGIALAGYFISYLAPGVAKGVFPAMPGGY
jgi:hypothetical protein